MKADIDAFLACLIRQVGDLMVLSTCRNGIDGCHQRRTNRPSRIMHSAEVLASDVA